MSEILVPVSFGELLDKIAILQIKSERMSDPAKLAHVRDELAALEHSWMAILSSSSPKETGTRISDMTAPGQRPLF